GLQKGDVLEKAGPKAIKDLDALRDIIQNKGAGDELTLAIVRNDQPMQVKAKLEATSRPASGTGGQKGVMGVQLDEGPKNTGVLITSVTAGLPAEKAGLQKGDLVLKVDGKATPTVEIFQDLVGRKSPGDTVTLDLKRDDKEMQV